MRRVLVILAVASAGCGCPELAQGLSHYRAGLRARATAPDRVAPEFGEARRLLIAALDGCALDRELVPDLCARIAHCHLEFGRRDLADAYLDRAHEALAAIPSWRHEGLPGDAVLLTWVRGEHHARRAGAIWRSLGERGGREADRAYADLERELREARTLLYQAHSRAGDALLVRFLQLRKAELQLETARYHERVAVRQNLEEERDRARAAAEAAQEIARGEIRAGAPFDREFRALAHEAERLLERLSGGR